MVDVRNDPYGDRTVVRKSGSGKTIAIILAAVLVIIGVLFATGFWKADVTGGDIPEVSVQGGALPKVDVDSKEVVVGTKTEEVEVPTVGVKDNGED
ncbi:MAG: hypothetical protein V4533_14745 [Pseudomonadota bacterium]|jgi:hypothetical protein|uniref:hypothetical protein n=1 Tax=Sphingobium sp. CECT 9361 TaxID=2845384 RepID=UPI001E2D1C42|nr:hypothetical protein [Sphingobium sp. CECT 9361]CAH0356495.1 hypothetical protein SPH9361_04135 [Sphingobium sp. CECT 9361]